MASVMSRTWKAMASTQARASWARPGAPGEAGDDAPGGRVPPGAAQAGERGHEGDAAAVADRLGQGADLGRLVDDAQPVAQPLDGGAGDEGRSLERVGRPPIPSPPTLRLRTVAANGPRSQATLTVRPSGAAGRSGPALARTKLPVP